MAFQVFPLAILYPKCNFVLVDSIGKKIKVVNNIIEEIGVKNCIALNLRAENLDQKFDFIVSRAVTNMSKFKKYASGKINTKQKNKIKKRYIIFNGWRFRQRTF